MAKTKRNGEIELFRFICAIIIMLRHSSALFEGFGPLCFKRGALGVEFFFFVSGYLMACSASKSIARNPLTSVGKDTTTFISRKFLGLMPEFLLAWGINFVIAQVATFSGFKNVVKELAYWVFELVPVSMAGFSKGHFHMAAWYISAMLLALLVLYPICRKNFDTYTRIIAPLLAIFTLGYLTMNFGTPLGPVHPAGNLAYRGFVRAIGEISLGAAMYPGVQALQQKELKKSSKSLVSLVILFCSLISLAWMCFGKDSHFDTLCMALIAVVVFLSFTHQSLLANKFDNKLCYWLGKISMLIYLTHDEWAKLLTSKFKDMVTTGAIQDSLTNRAIALTIYFGVTFAIAAIVGLVSNLIRNVLASKKQQAA